jgi:DNA-binding NarL/FixJ family response regulator
MPALALVHDLVFQSKLQAAATGVGVPLRFARQAPEALQGLAEVSLVLVDLHLAGALELVQAIRRQQPGLAILGYGSHVDTALLQQALAAGCSRVLPRSAFVQQLPAILREA